MSSSTSALPGQPEPAWEIARLFPAQGQWSESSFLSFTESLNQLVELVDGHVEVLEMPTKSHQKIVQYLFQLVQEFLVTGRLGDAICAPYRVRLRGETFREPDVVLYLSKNLARFGERFGESPDLVMEVVSDDPASRARDYEDKRRDYALSGISEYWIIDPAARRILVLSLAGNVYSQVEEFGDGETASSRLLDGFHVDLTRLLTLVDS